MGATAEAETFGNLGQGTYILCGNENRSDSLESATFDEVGDASVQVKQTIQGRAGNAEIATKRIGRQSTITEIGVDIPLDFLAQRRFQRQRIEPRLGLRRGEAGEGKILGHLYQKGDGFGLRIHKVSGHRPNMFTQQFACTIPKHEAVRIDEREEMLLSRGLAVGKVKGIAGAVRRKRQAWTRHLQERDITWHKEKFEIG